LKSVRIINENGGYSYVNEPWFVLNKANRWKDWYCSVGQTNLFLDQNSNLRGGICKHRKEYGKFLDEDFVLNPTKEMTLCQRVECLCFNDVNILRYKKNVEPLTKGTVTKEEIVKMEPTNTFFDFTLNWDMLTKCNFSCTYCWPGAHNAKTYPEDTIKNTFLKFHTVFKNYKVFYNMLGGEPTLIPWLPVEVEKLAKINENRIFITTNGSRSFKYLHHLAKYSELSFSVHLHQPKLDRLAKKINQLSKLKDIYPIQVRILCPAHQTHILKYFLKLLDEPNYYLSIERLKRQYLDDPDQAGYEYTDQHISLFTKLNKYYSKFFSVKDMPMSVSDDY